MPLDRTWFNTLIDDDGSGLTGTVWNKAQVGNLLTEVDKVLAYGQYFNGNSQAIASGTHVAVQWDQEDLDPFNLLPVVGGSGITPSAGYGGVYFFSVAVTFNINATGTRAAALRKNGATILGGAFTYNGATAGELVTTWTQGIVALPAAGSDYIEVLAYQTSGVTLTLARAQLSVMRLG